MHYGTRITTASLCKDSTKPAHCLLAVLSRISNYCKVSYPVFYVTTENGGCGRIEKLQDVPEMHVTVIPDSCALHRLKSNCHALLKSAETPICSVAGREADIPMFATTRTCSA